MHDYSQWKKNLFHFFSIQSCDLEEVMMDALVNDKPEFVRLFIDNGANIYDFLTYSRLQRLYCTISPKCLLYTLLLRKHEESRLTLTGMSGQQHKEVMDTCPLFTLHEVSRVLKDFLHDACRGFYQDQKSGCKKKMVSILKSIYFKSGMSGISPWGRFRPYEVLTLTDCTPSFNGQIAASSRRLHLQVELLLKWSQLATEITSCTRDKACNKSVFLEWDKEDIGKWPSTECP